MVRNYLREHGGRYVADVAKIETPVTTEYKSNDPYIGLDSIGSSSGSISPTTIASEQVVGAVRVLPEGPVISKLRPYLNKVAYIPASMTGTLASTELLCVQPIEKRFGWYLYGVLKLKSTVRQLNPVSTGSTHPRVTRGDVAGVVVPWIDDSILAGGYLRTAQVANFAAEKLMTAAKLLVEGLIERRISEEDLEDAEDALKRGDQCLDRALLARLTEDGIDVDGKVPLFPDSDALNAAIEGSQCHKPSNGQVT